MRTRWAANDAVKAAAWEQYIEQLVAVRTAVETRARKEEERRWRGRGRVPQPA